MPNCRNRYVDRCKSTEVIIRDIRSQDLLEARDLLDLAISDPYTQHGLVTIFEPAQLVAAM